MRLIVCAILVPVLIASAGCDESSASRRNQAPLPKHVPGEGVVHGVVKFTGPAPVMKPITATDACCDGEPRLFEETVVVNPGGTLRNVFVYLEGAPATDGSDRPPALIDQVRCRYTPHALGVQVSQPLRIRSSDPTMHNVHYVPRMNQARNLSMTQAGQESRVSFDYAEFVRLKCDVHPWMTAWVGVFENPFFAVTEDEGAFRIEGIPAGDYTLVAWHEVYGRQEQAISIVDGQASVQTEFAFGTSR